MLDTAIEWIARHLTPDQVFTDADLRVWAHDNGFTEE
jgi:hypothetical protein